MNLKNLVTRTVAGAVYVAIVLLGILGGHFAHLFVFGGFLILALTEYNRLTATHIKPKGFKIINILAGIAVYLSVYSYVEGNNLSLLKVVSLSYILVMLICSVFNQQKDILRHTVFSIFSHAYITLPLSLLLLLTSAFPYASKMHVLPIFVLLWVNDTAAFLSGSLFGKHKLIERISPKKTIEGFIGGVIFTILATLIFSYLFPAHSLIFWIGFGLIVSLFGTMGDLFESLLKRTNNVKDSGNIMPGHGGILDRIDSLLFAVPAIYIYLTLISLFN